VDRRITRHIAQHSLSISAVTLLLPAALLTSSCQRIAPPVPEHLASVVERVKSIHAPDSRVELFQIELTRAGNQLIASGEVTDHKLREVLLDSLLAAAGSLDIIDSIQVLPAPDLQPNVYGIVAISVANMRREQALRAELVNQILLGTVVKLYKREGGFYFTHNWDRYLGWVSSSSLVKVDSLTAAAWRQGPRVICTANYGLVREQASSAATPIIDLVPGAVLRKVGQTGNWVEVQTPDGQVGYVEKELVVAEATLRDTPASRDRLVSTAKSYLGIPYLWGGTSSKAFDCSGFVQTVFRMNNISLPRDASQMVLEGDPVDLGDQFENVLTGDLLFFGPTPERITHVAMYLDDQRFIHSDGLVHINSLDPDDPLYNEYRHRTLRAIKRIQPE